MAVVKIEGTGEEECLKFFFRNLLLQTTNDEQQTSSVVVCLTFGVPDNYEFLTGLGG